MAILLEHFHALWLELEFFQEPSVKPPPSSQPNENLLSDPVEGRFDVNARARLFHIHLPV